MGVVEDRQNVLLDVLVAGQVEAARGFAARVRALAEFTGLAEELAGGLGVEQFASMELAGSCRQGRLSAVRDLVDAARFVEALPETVSLLAAGRLFVHQARVLLEVTANVTPQVARAVERRLLPAAVGLAPPDLRRAARRVVLAVESELDSPGVAERLHRARAGRRVWVRPGEDGMALISILAPAERVARWAAELDRLVAAEKHTDRAAGVWRSADQIRVDLLMAMPAGQPPGQPAGRPCGDGQPAGTAGCPRPAAGGATVVVHVPAATVTGFADAPGYLAGYGPVSAEHVRLLLPGARLRRLLVDERTGQPLHTDTPTPTRRARRVRTRARSQAGAPGDGYPRGGERRRLEHGGVAAGGGDREESWDRERILAFLTEPAVLPERAEPQHDPSAGLRRFIELRDLHCRGVGCSTPAARCHLDHRTPYPAGATSRANLQALSSSCHRAKHTGWTCQPQPDGSTRWTSPLGRTYHRPPPHDPPPHPLRPAPRPPHRPPPPPTRPPGTAQHGTDQPLDPPGKPEPDPPPPSGTALPDEPPF